MDQRTQLAVRFLQIALTEHDGERNATVVDVLPGAVVDGVATWRLVWIGGPDEHAMRARVANAGTDLDIREWARHAEPALDEVIAGTCRALGVDPRMPLGVDIRRQLTEAVQRGGYRVLHNVTNEVLGRDPYDPSPLPLG